MKKELTIEEKIEKLAKKAARYVNRLSEYRLEEIIEGEGTSVIFETVDQKLYDEIMEADDDDGTLFDQLDDLMWDLV